MVIYGEHDEKTLSQFKSVLKNAEKGALMADGHIGYVMPIGGVTAYSGIVAPAGVGYDIACGNMAVKLDIKTGQVFDKLPQTLDWIQENPTTALTLMGEKALGVFTRRDLAIVAPMAASLETSPLLASRLLQLPLSPSFGAAFVIQLT